MAFQAIGKTFHVDTRRVVCIIVSVVSIWSDLLCFVDDLCQVLNVSLNSIGCVTKVRSGILEGNASRQMYI